MAKALYEKKNDCAEGIDERDWRFNLRLAKKRLRGKRRKDLGSIYSAIIPRRKVNGRVKQIVCEGCRTPMLFGYVLDGHRVTRRKEFCSAACKMKKGRRRR